jgi:hypothetical protein
VVERLWRLGHALFSLDDVLTAAVEVVPRIPVFPLGGLQFGLATDSPISLTVDLGWKPDRNRRCLTPHTAELLLPLVWQSKTKLSVVTFLLKLQVKSE